MTGFILSITHAYEEILEVPLVGMHVCSRGSRVLAIMKDTFRLEACRVVLARLPVPR